MPTGTTGALRCVARWRDAEGGEECRLHVDEAGRYWAQVGPAGALIPATARLVRAYLRGSLSD